MNAWRRRAWPLAGVLSALLSIQPAIVFAHGSHASTEPEKLARIGSAPDFALTSQDGTTFSFAAVRDKVVALNFIFTRCADVCPTATYKMVRVQEELGSAFGRDVAFVTVTVDPEHDTPEVLSEYARGFGCDLSGWVFLTGTSEGVAQVARDYGVFSGQQEDGEIVHVMLTSLIDRKGNMRVQYLGEVFDPDELLKDLRTLVAEDGDR